MDRIQELSKLMLLKEVPRTVPVQSRKESVAEHTWSCLILADYFLQQVKIPLNKQRIYDLLLYHDLLELETGDIDFLDREGRKIKAEREKEALFRFMKILNSERYSAFKDIVKELEEGKTIEAQFAHAIDKIDPFVHSLNYPWKFKERGISKEMLLESKEKYFLPFPELFLFWREVLDYYDQNGYLA